MAVSFAFNGRQDRRLQANTLSKVASSIAKTAKDKLTGVDVAALDDGDRQKLFAEVEALVEQAEKLQGQAASLAGGL